jgi:UDP-2,3-diacylglucosamine pyrophosphatase LpxH
MAKNNELGRSSQGQVYDTLILSDLHLGSEVSRAEEAHRLLEATSFRRLILLGDIFCDLNFARLKREHWELLSFVRKLSNPRRDVEVVWVEGNHDCGLTEVMSHLVGVKVYEEYSWRFAGRRYLAVHGHQYDRFLVNNSAISAIGAFLYIHLQRFDSKSHRLSRYLDRQNTNWLRLSAKVEAGAIAYARFCGADVVFCGHTHEALESEHGGVRYLNSGCWTSESPTYITVDESGASVRRYVAQPSFDFAAGLDMNSALPNEEDLSAAALSTELV